MRQPSPTPLVAKPMSVLEKPKSLRKGTVKVLANMSPSLKTATKSSASQARWREAQQAYFRAYTAEPDNPDYQFNLAVALDQLRQPRLALQYYQSALAAAAARPAAFDQAQATARVRELQQ